MARTSIDRDSVEFVKVPVTTPPGVSVTNQPVQVAVVAATDRPTELDWVAGAWEGNVAKALVGPGHIALAPGSYNVWVRITDSPEVPVLTAGQITVT